MFLSARLVDGIQGERVITIVGYSLATGRHVRMEGIMKSSNKARILGEYPALSHNINLPRIDLQNLRTSLTYLPRPSKTSKRYIWAA
jgi:hypothetical protein